MSDFLAGVLSEERRGDILAHVERCADCQWVLAAGDGAQAHFNPSPSSPPEASVLSAGHRLSRYLLEDRLGEGGMGVVYAARDLVLGRTVALKLLRPGMGGEKERARLVREAQAMARLAHPNVLPLFELGMEGEHIFLVMERVEGPTLATWLTEHKRPWREVLALLLQAGEGLAAAHRAGLVHRDFKPGNVLVDAEGRPRVTDFGLVREGERGEVGGVPSLETEEPLTQAGAVLGTPAYMSPEQLAGHEVDARGDQFSFCVALHEALYGMRPFDARARDQVTRWRREPLPRSPRLPRELRAAIDRGLALNPEDRFPSMDALLAALRRPPRLHWRPVVTGLMVLALVLLGADVLMRRNQEPWGPPGKAVPVPMSMGEPVDLDAPGMNRVKIIDPSIVKVESMEGGVLRLTPVEPGMTELWVWMDDGQRQKYVVSVREQ
ncbi:protein kinase [Archangium violaceum]|uniref:serine/threonine-protein kinase n=1 Tax=Archangium violaceum TaxID=83451 RepID=UPI0037C09F3B